MRDFKPERLKKLIHNIILTSILGGVYYFFIKLTGLRLPCFSYALLKFHCPGCGVTRMCIAMLDGNLKLAFRQNQFVFCLLPVLILWGIHKAYKYIFNKEPGLCLAEKIAVIIVFFAATAFSILRNLPAFEFLAPIPW